MINLISNNGVKVAIIPAAGRGSRMLSLTDNFAKCLVPIEGKPIIGHQLDYFKKHDYKDICIVTGYNEDSIKEYVDLIYKDQFDSITYVTQDTLSGLGGAVELAVDKVIDKFANIRNMFILLGDTLLNESPEDFDDAIYYREVEHGDQSRWCILKGDDTNMMFTGHVRFGANGEMEGPKHITHVTEFLDKPSMEDVTPTDNGALIGAYNFTNPMMFRKAIKMAKESGKTIAGEFQISTIMEKYIAIGFKIRTVRAKNWEDVGEIDTYIKCKKNMTRYFNEISVTDHNTIVKSSKENADKIEKEIAWYLNLPNRLRIFTPQFIDYNADSSFFSEHKQYELEYINHVTCASKFMYDNNDVKYWNRLFETTFTMLRRFKSESINSVPLIPANKMFKDAILTKLNNRIADTMDSSTGICNDTEFLSLYLNNAITVNGKELDGRVSNYDYIAEQYDEIFKGSNYNKYYQIVHGDLFFGNMLFDSNSDTLKVIDPKGHYDSSVPTIYGDVRYDVAKLYHSIVGNYDYISNDVYMIYNNDPKDFQYKILTSNQNQSIIDAFEKKLVECSFDLREIKFITATLFLSMIPLHKDNINRCMMFYIKAVEIFNSIKVNNTGVNN